MRILVICDRDWAHPQGGGAGINLRKQVEYWIEWGHRVDILTVSYPGAVQTETSDRLRIKRLGSKYTVYFAVAAQLIQGAARQADVVLEVVNGVPWMSKLVTRKPTVVMVHHVCQQQYEMEFKGVARVFGKFLEAKVMPAAYRHLPFLTVSETSKRELVQLGIPEAHIEVVHNGTDHAVEPPFDKYEAAILEGNIDFKSEIPTLVYLGRLKRYKRVDLLLELLSPLLRARSSLRLMVVGDGDDKCRLQSLVRQLGVERQVSFTGFVDNHTKLELLASAWIAVTASDIEGWGISTMEAAAMGCPTVALGKSGLQESVISERTGFVCTSRTEFMERCVRLLDDMHLRRAMAQAAARRALSFTWGDAAKKTLDVLTRASAGRLHGSSESLGSSL
ncbi:MAG: hypothetical protein C4318_06175 [Acidimicrobiia bacterium]